MKLIEIVIRKVKLLLKEQSCRASRIKILELQPNYIKFFLGEDSVNHLM